MSRKKIHIDKNNLKLIGTRIKSIRESVNLNQDKFGESIGISQGAVSDIETGKIKPTKPILLAIQYRYSVSPKEILTGEGFSFKKIKYRSMKVELGPSSIHEYTEEISTPPDPMDQIINGFKQLFHDQNTKIEKLSNLCKDISERLSSLEEHIK